MVAAAALVAFALTQSAATHSTGGYSSPESGRVTPPERPHEDAAVGDATRTAESGRTGESGRKDRPPVAFEPGAMELGTYITDISLHYDQNVVVQTNEKIACDTELDSNAKPKWVKEDEVWFHACILVADEEALQRLNRKDPSVRSKLFFLFSKDYEAPDERKGWVVRTTHDLMERSANLSSGMVAAFGFHQYADSQP
jgi:hypothetical protein